MPAEMDDGRRPNRGQQSIALVPRDREPLGDQPCLAGGTCNIAGGRIRPVPRGVGKRGGMRANVSDDGGGAYVGAGSSLTMRGSASLVGNKSRVWAGGIEVRNAILVLEASSRVSRNRSRLYAGGIASNESALTVSDSAVVTGNVASRLAGGIHLGAETRFEASGTAFVVGNEAGRGGGIWASRTAELFLRDSASVTDNVALRRGGGIFTRRAAVHVCSGTVAISPNDPDDPPPTLPC